MKIVKIILLANVFLLVSSQITTAYSPMWRYGFSVGAVTSSAAAGAAVGRKAAGTWSKDSEHIDKHKRIGTLVGTALGTIFGTVLSYFAWFNHLPSIKSESVYPEDTNEKETDNASNLPSNVDEQADELNHINSDECIEVNESGTVIIKKRITQHQSKDDETDQLKQAVHGHTLQENQEALSLKKESINGSEALQKSIQENTIQQLNELIVDVKQKNISLEDVEIELKNMTGTLNQIQNKRSPLDTSVQHEFSTEKIENIDQLQSACQRIQEVILAELKAWTSDFCTGKIGERDYLPVVRDLNGFYGSIANFRQVRQMRTQIPDVLS